MVIQGRIENGQIIMPPGVVLPEGSSVTIRLVPAANGEPNEAEGRTLLERLGPVVGSAPDLPVDGARNVDHYLYGLPKR